MFTFTTHFTSSVMQTKPFIITVPSDINLIVTISVELLMVAGSFVSQQLPNDGESLSGPFGMFTQSLAQLGESPMTVQSNFSSMLVYLAQDTHSTGTVSTISWLICHQWQITIKHYTSIRKHVDSTFILKISVFNLYIRNFFAYSGIRTQDFCITAQTCVPLKLRMYTTLYLHSLI